LSQAGQQLRIGLLHDVSMKPARQGHELHACDQVPPKLRLAFAAARAGLRFPAGNAAANRAALTKQASIAKAFSASRHKVIFSP
jgi:hypothetical protein